MINPINSSSLLARIVKYSDEPGANQTERCIIIRSNGDYIMHPADVRISDVSILCKSHLRRITACD